jgi:hypothetical protein
MWGTSSKHFRFDSSPTQPITNWVINETPWDGDEMIVDAHTIVNEWRAMEPALSHFLPLIVAGEFTGVQGIPLEPGADHRAEKR